MGSLTDRAGDRFCGAGRWNWEARQASLLAAELGVALDDEALLHYDIRDLMALQLRLRIALRKGARSAGVAEKLHLGPVLRRLFALVSWRLRPARVERGQ